MKTRIKVETVIQPLFKVQITNHGRQGWFLINADNEAAALLEAKKAYPTYKIGYCYECLENQTICWS